MNDILENKIREIGREIYSIMGHEVPSLFDRKSWNGRLTEWVMKDEPLKVRLFRFVDVLPCLKTDSMVTKVLNEYFSDLLENPFMKGIGAVSGLAPFLAAKAVRTGVQSMAAQFVAGCDEYEALKVFLKLRKQGIAFSADLLGEVVISDKEASEYAERYEKLISRLSEETSNWHEDPTLDFDTHGPIPVFDVSLKISSFCPHIDPMDWEGSIENAMAGLSSVAMMATKLGGSITLDMEHYYFKDLTIEILDRLLGKFPDIRFPGIALQAYLPETREDLFRVIQMAKKSGRRVLLRLVKGAYWDYETVVNRQKGWPVPVFLKKEETDSNYEDLTRILLENIEYVRPAIASHNIRSISHAIAVADSMKLPSGAFEFQMIFGMAEPIRSALKNMNFRVRSYTPIGELIPGMAYLIRRLLENTSNQSFLRKSFSDQVALDELLKPPQPVSEGEDPAILAHGFSNEPLTDFSKAENRRNMEQALEQVRKDFTKSFLVGEAYEEFCGRLKQAAKSIVISRPENPGVFMGPVIDEGAVQKIKGYIELGEKEAKTLLVRNVDVGDGHFVGPAIFTDVSPDSRLAQEEIFGPVLVVMRTPDLDGALEIANGAPYALTGGIFSRSPANIEKAKDNFRVGKLYINRKITGALVGRQPFGGFGMSGIGYKAGGPDYLPQFMNAKSVSENTLRRGFAPSGPQDN